MSPRRRPSSRKASDAGPTARAACWGLWAALLAPWCAPGQPVLIYLNNGDRLSGVIISESTNRVVLSNAWAREIVLQADKIVWRTTPPALPPATTPSPEVAAAVAKTAPTNGVAAAAAPSAGTPPAPSAPPPPPPTPPPPPPPPPKPKHWSGEVQVGLSVVQNTTSRYVYYGNARIAYSKGRLRDTTDVNGSYGRTDGRVDANQANLGNKLDYDLNPRWYAYVLAGVGYDQVRKIDLRCEAGPGLGWRAMTSPNFTLCLEGGADYQGEDRSGEPDLQRCYGRLSESGTWRISPRFSMDHRVSFYPGLTEWGEYRFRGEANLRYLVAGNLSLNVAVVDSYDTSSAAGVPPNELQIRSFVGLKF